MPQFVIGNISVELKTMKKSIVKNSRIVQEKLSESPLQYADYVASSNDIGNCILFVRSTGFSRLYQAQAYEGEISLQQIPQSSGNSLPSFESCTVAQAGNVIGVVGAYKKQHYLFIHDIVKQSSARLQSNVLNKKSIIFSANQNVIIFNGSDIYLVNLETMSIDLIQKLSPIYPKGEQVTVYHRKVPIFVSQDGIWSYDQGLFIKISAGISQCQILGNYFVNLITSFIKEIPILIEGIEFEKQNYLQSKLFLESNV